MLVSRTMAKPVMPIDPGTRRHICFHRGSASKAGAGAVSLDGAGPADPDGTPSLLFM